MTFRRHPVSTRYRLGVAVGPALLCAACFYVSYWPVHAGLSFSIDSIYYLDTAIRLSSLHDWSQLRAQWPPAYPIFISLFLKIVPWPGTAAALLNGFCLTTTVLITWYTCFKITGQSLLSSALAMLCLASPVTYWVLQFAWSENPYALFIALHLLFIWLDIRRPSLGYFTLAILCGSLAFLTRYVGICVLATGSVYTAWRLVHGAADRVRRVAILCASLGLASTYLVHNVMVFGRPFGNHGKSLAKYSLSELVDTIVYCTVRLPESLVAGSGVTVVLILIALTVIFILTRILNHRPVENDGEARDSQKRAQFLAYLLLLIGVYYTVVIAQLVTIQWKRESINLYSSFRHIASSSVILPVVLAILLRKIASFELIAKHGFRLVAAASAGILLSGSVAIVNNWVGLRDRSKTERFWRYGSELNESLDQARSFIIDAAGDRRIVHVTNGMLGDLEKEYAIHYRTLFYRRRFLSGRSDFLPTFWQISKRELTLDLRAGANVYRIEYHDPNSRGFSSPQALAKHVQKVMTDNEADSIVLLANDAGEDQSLAAAWSDQQLIATDSVRTGELHWIRLQRLDLN